MNSRLLSTAQKTSSHPTCGSVDCDTHFKSSVFTETVTFTQGGVFSMRDYHLVQSGPAFAEDLDATLSRSGAYVVKTKSHDDGKALAGMALNPLTVDEGPVGHAGDGCGVLHVVLR